MTHQSLLPQASTQWELAAEEAAATFSPLPVPNGSLWNPDTCPEHMLGWLAFNLSVDLWNPGWPVWRKRQVIRDAIQNARLKGTRAGLERYLAQVDARLVSLVTPPLKMFAGKSYTKANLDRFYAVMPQLRIYAHRNRNRHVFGKMFAGRGVGPGRFALISIARTGRQTYLFDPLDNSLTKLVTQQIENFSETRSKTEVTRVVTPGKPGNRFFAGGRHGFAGQFLGKIEKPSIVRTVSLDTDYVHTDSSLRLSTVDPSFEPLSVRYENGHETWRGAPGKFFAGRSCGHRKFAVPSAAWLHEFQMVRLHDPDRTPALRHGSRCFAGNRIGIAAHTAHIRVQVNIPHRKHTFFAGRSASRVFARPVDHRVINATLEAVHVAKAAHEKILVSFQLRREPTFGDALPLDGSRRLGQLIPRR
jgi:hypothetical protein